MTTSKPIPASHMDLLERPLLAALATTLPNGTPQVTAVWFNYEDGYVHINSAAGRLKDRAIRAKPYLAIMVMDPEDQADPVGGSYAQASQLLCSIPAGTMNVL